MTLHTPNRKTVEVWGLTLLQLLSVPLVESVVLRLAFPWRALSHVLPLGVAVSVLLSLALTLASSQDLGFRLVRKPHQGWLIANVTLFVLFAVFTRHLMRLYSFMPVKVGPLLWMALGTAMIVSAFMVHLDYRELDRWVRTHPARAFGWVLLVWIPYLASRL